MSLRLLCCWILLAGVAVAGSTMAFAAPSERSVALSDSIRQAFRAQDLSAARRFAGEQLRSDDALDPVVDAESALRRATTLTYLSLAERNLEDFDTAEAHARRALRLTREFIGAEHGTTAAALNNLAGVLKERGKLVEARGAYELALRLRKMIFGEQHPQTLAALNNLGTLLLDQGDWPEAERVLRQALSVARSLSEPASASSAITAQNLVRALLPQGSRVKLRECAELLEQAAATNAPDASESSSPTRLLSLAGVQALRARVALAQGDANAAAALFEQAVDQRIRARGAEQTEVARWRMERAHALAESGDREQSQVELDTARRLVEELLDGDQPLSIEVRTAWAESALHDGRVEAALIALTPAARDYDRARARLGRRWRRATAPLPSPWSALAAARLLAGDPDGAWTALQRAQARLTSEMTEARVRSADEVRQLLEPDEALVGWLDTDNGHWAYVLRAGQALQWTALSITAPRAASKWRSIVSEFGASAFAAPREDELQELATTQQDQWLTPVWGYLVGARRLVLVPHRSMQAVSVATWPRLATQTAPAVWVAPSASVWAHLRESGSGSGKGVLAVGDPVFASATPLPSTRREVEVLQRLFDPVTVLVQEDAAVGPLEDALRTHPPRVLHLATHARIDPFRPEDSRLELSATAEDTLAALAEAAPVSAVIRVGDIAERWRLDTELVTLSACSTALGRQGQGEGALGFAQAFLHAGVRSLLMSRWDVDDQATATLMEFFYRRLAEGQAPAVALHRAQRQLREMRNSAGQRPYAHPWYWAAFVVVGEG